MSSELSIENNLARVNLDEEDIEVVLQENMTHYFKEIPRKTFGHRKSHPGLYYIIWIENHVQYIQKGVFPNNTYMLVRACWKIIFLVYQLENLIQGADILSVQLNPYEIKLWTQLPTKFKLWHIIPLLQFESTNKRWYRICFQGTEHSGVYQRYFIFIRRNNCSKACCTSRVSKISRNIENWHNQCGRWWTLDNGDTVDNVENFDTWTVSWMLSWNNAL